jgi:hypothetical protein
MNKTILSNHHYLTRRFNVQEPKEINLTLSSNDNVTEREGQIKNIFDLGISLSNYKMALTSISYPSSYLINLCTFVFVDSHDISDDKITKNEIPLIIKDRITIAELKVQIMSIFKSDEVFVHEFGSYLNMEFKKWKLLVIESNYSVDHLIENNDGLSVTFNFENPWHFASNFYVYADCIHNRWSNQSLLATVKAEGILNEYIDKSFSKLRYIPCNKSYINSIEIFIYDQNKNLIKFEQNSEIICNLKLKYIK